MRYLLFVCPSFFLSLLFLFPKTGCKNTFVYRWNMLAPNRSLAFASSFVRHSAVIRNPASSNQTLASLCVRDVNEI